MKNILGKIFSICLLVIALSGCKQRGVEGPQPHAESSLSAAEPKIDYYTCTMHRFIHEHKPGNCPICGMKLVPIYAQPAESQPQGNVAEPLPSGRGAVVLEEEKRQRIGVKTETAEKRPLLREIEAAGRVAYDPDLLVAQSDYLVALRTGGGELGGLQGGLAQATKLRLQLLGMSEAQIAELRRRAKPDVNLLVPQSGQRVLVYASVFESDLPWIRPGMGVQVEIPGDPQPRTTELAGISPVIDATTRTATLRLSLANPEGRLRPEMYLKVKLQGETEPVLQVPDSALIDTGTEQLVFVESGPGRYEPRQVRVGRRGSGGVEVLQGLDEGARVVTSGNFLLDSESRLRGGR